MRTAMSFLRLPLKQQGPPIRPSIFFRRRRAAFPWRGLGTVWDSGPTLLRPITLDDCEVPTDLQLTDDGAGFPAMLNVVLPLFNLGTAAVALGLCRAAVAGTAAHLKNCEIRASWPEPRREPAYVTGATRGDAD